MHRLRMEIAARWFCMKIHIRQWWHRRKRPQPVLYGNVRVSPTVLPSINIRKEI